MADHVEPDYDREKLQRIGLVVQALAEMREEETISLFRQVVESAFPDSVGHTVVEVLLQAGEPFCLREMAARCGRSRRSVLPDGRVRAVLEKLRLAGMIVNHGTHQKPRYLLDRSDKRVQALVRMYGHSNSQVERKMRGRSASEASAFLAQWR